MTWNSNKDNHGCNCYFKLTDWLLRYLCWNALVELVCYHQHSGLLGIFNLTWLSALYSHNIFLFFPHLVPRHYGGAAPHGEKSLQDMYSPTLLPESLSLGQFGENCSLLTMSDVDNLVRSERKVRNVSGMKCRDIRYNWRKVPRSFETR